MSNEFDHTSLSDAFARPGIDPRQWVSYGTVDPDNPGARSVRFNDDQGNPLPTGPLVTVTLQPSGITVVCRVASFIAGIGESAWFPISAKDEVIVAIPQGSERAGPVIVGRLNQAIDTFPSIVAGQDATKNTFGFWRLRTPFIIETAESFLIRSAKTGSQIGIDPTGQVIINNGDKNNIIIGSDVVSLSSGDESTFLQLNFSENRITLATQSARMELAASGESIFFAPGSLNIGTAGARGKGHAVSVEQLLTWLNNMISVMATQGAFNAGSPFDAATWTLIPGSATAALNALWALAIPAQSTPVPLSQNGAPGGNTSLLQASYQLLTAGFALPLSTLDPTGLIPGIGVAALMY